LMVEVPVCVGGASVCSTSVVESTAKCFCNAAPTNAASTAVMTAGHTLDVTPAPAPTPSVLRCTGGRGGITIEPTVPSGYVLKKMRILEFIP
jgi:hypothetical protein